MLALALAAVVALTSLGAYLWGRRRLDLPRAGLGRALAGALEALGLAALFFLANLGLLVIPLLVARGLGSPFVSVYSVDYVAIGAVAIVQGLVFRGWRDRR